MKRKNKKITKKCKLSWNLFWILNLSLSIGLEGRQDWQDCTIPKLDDSQHHSYDTLAQQVNTMTGTQHNTIRMANADKSAMRLDMRIHRHKFKASNKIRNCLVKQRNGNGVNTLKIVQ